MDVAIAHRMRFWKAVAVPALLWAAGTASAVASAVGHTSGEGSVSPTGEAQYHIPLSLPSGINGIQPSLSLSYSHTSGDGILGVGWSLGGLSTIHRCGQTLVQDGAIAPIDLSGGDRLCLDGQRLRRTGGTYGQSGSTYQTEIEIFSRITANGTGGQPPNWFKVEGKDGLYYFYGGTADSRIESHGTTVVREWALNRIEDRAGNYLTVTYTKDVANGSYRPNEIRYTGTNAGTPAYNLHFQYEDRPLGDRPGSYFAGGLIRETQRLNRIEVRHNSTIVRRYNLSYGATGPSGRSRLDSIQECGLNAVDCLPSTQLAWMVTAAGWESEGGGVAIDNANSAIPVDLNGDGFEDLAYFDSGTGTWKVLHGSASGYAASAVNTGFGSTLHFQNVMVGDVAGTGRQALLVPHTNNVLYWLRHDGSGYVATSTGVTLPTGIISMLLADIDGDGRDDVVYATDTTVYWRRSTGSGTTFASAAPLWTQPQWHLNDPEPFSWRSFRSMQRVADFNGDGRSDLVLGKRYDMCSGEPGCGPLWRYEFRALLSIGTAMTDQVIVSTQSPLPAPPLLADINGDGLTDVLWAEGSPLTWRIRFAVGARSPAQGGFTAALNTGIDASGYSSALITDFDGDGRSDLLTPIGGAYQLCRSNGETFSACITSGISIGASPKVTDINGDGLPDLAYSISGTWRRRLHMAGVPDLLQNVTDGLGNQATFAYAPLAQSPAYTKGSGAAFPIVDFVGPLYVVTQMQASDGNGGLFTLSHRYESARLHLQGRGFLGFAARHAEDSRTGIKTREAYRQDFPYIGALTSQITWQPNGTTKLAELTNTWQAKSYASGWDARRLPFVSGSSQQTYELGGPFDGTLVTTVTTTASLDDWGNPIDTLVTTSSPAGDTFTSRTEVPSPASNMLNDITNWCLGQARRAEVTNTRPGMPTLVRTTAAEYDAQFCRISEQTLEPGAADPRLRLKRSFDYDTCGNTRAVTQTGDRGDGTLVARTTTTEFTPDCRFPQTIINAEGHRQDLAWDPALGVRTDLYDENNLRTQWLLDGFGRLARENRPDGSYSTWTYAWCSSGCGLLYAQGSYRLTVTESTGAARSAIYDRFGRTIRESTMLLGGTQSHVDSYYNQRGLLAYRSVPHTGSGLATSFSYDLLGRILTETPPGLPATTYGYEGLRSWVSDARQHSTTQIQNALGETIQVIDAHNASMNYAYDAFGNLTHTSDPAGHQIVLGYDLRGRKTSSSDPDMGAWSYQYNSFGELIAQTDAKNQPVTLHYDGLGRLVHRIEPEGTTTWSWDTAPNGIGRLDTVSSPGGYAEVYSYDALARTVEVATVIGAEVFPVTTTYDAQGRLAAIEYPESYEDLSVPAAPATISVPASSTSGNYTISWSASAGATGYELFEATNGSFSGEVLAYSGPSTSTPVSGKPSGTWYYRVKACNPAGCSTARAGGNGVVVSIAPGVPASITVPASSTTGSYSVSWGTSTGTVTAYQLYESTDSGFTGQTQVYSGAGTTLPIAGKGNGTYYYRVRACNGPACSGYRTGSNPTNVTLPPSVPASISIPSTSTTGSYTVSWGTSTGTVTAYELYEATNSGFTGQVQIYSGTGSSKPISGKGNGTYYYRVRACNGSACSGYRTGSNPATVTLPPSVPPSISVPASSTGDYSVSWGSSTGTVTAYQLYEATNSSFSGQVLVHSGTATSKAFNAKPAGTYYYRVRACNGSACSSYRTAANPINVTLAVPGMPASITISGGVDPVFSVSWGTSTGSVAAYELYEAKNSGFSGQYLVYTGLGTATSINKHNQPGDYWYRVRACNASGCSAYRSAGPKRVASKPLSSPIEDGSGPTGGLSSPWPIETLFAADTAGRDMGAYSRPDETVPIRSELIQSNTAIASGESIVPEAQSGVAAVQLAEIRMSSPSFGSVDTWATDRPARFAHVPADVRATQEHLRNVARRLREQRGRSRALPDETENMPAVLRWYKEPQREAVARFGGMAEFQYAQAGGGEPFRFRVRYEYGAYGHLVRVVNDHDSGEVFWQATAMNAVGQVTGVQYGNGLSSSRLYDQVTGLLKQIDTGNVQSLRYDWDAVGNLTYRQDQLQGVSESFGYDALNRLETVTGPSPMTITYDPQGLGNLQSKTGVGTYTYHPQRPHQVVSTTSGGSYGYDANGNMTSRNGATLAWTSYNQPSSLVSGGNSATFSYGANRNRFRQVATSGGVTTQTIYVAGGQYERVTTAGSVEHRHYVTAGGEMVAVHTRRSDLSHETRYLHADHLGSVESITDAQGMLLARLSFDAFGQRRGSHWSGTPTAGDKLVIGSTTSRGYTFHEMLDGLGLVHMNGRVYDPALGRFLSADPFVQAPYNLQSLNRYSYVLNNPLSFTDPSGYFLKRLSRAVRSVGRFLRKNWRPIVAIAASVLTYGAVSAYFTPIYINSAAACLAKTPFLASVAGGMAAGAVGGGIMTGTLRGAAIGAATGAIAGSVSGYWSGEWTASRVAANSVAGGISSEIMGGSFRDGFRLALVVSMSSYADYGMASAMQQGKSPLLGLVRGALDIAGKIWNLPNTAVGLLYGGVGHVAGWAIGTNPYIRFENNSIQFINNPFTFSATAIGNVVLYNPSSAFHPDVIQLRSFETLGYEERQHTIQGQVLGPLYLPLHVVLGAAASAFNGRWHGPFNFLEAGPHAANPRPWP